MGTENPIGKFEQKTTSLGENTPPLDPLKEGIVLALGGKLNAKRIPNAPKKKPKEKPEKPRYFELPKGIKAKILSTKDKIRLKIKDAPDEIGPKLKRKGQSPTQKQLAQIRKNSEFYNPSNDGTPLIEIKEKDLDKVILTCGTKKNPVHYKLKEFLRIDPKDIGDAPKGTYFTKNGEYYRKITRLNPSIIKKFGRLHKELENIANKNLTIPKKNILTQGPKFMSNASKKLSHPSRINVRLYIDENYRAYGENLNTYVKSGKPSSEISYGSKHTAGNALDLRTFILVGGKRIDGREAEDLLKEAITAEWTKHGGGIGFYTNSRSFHMDSRKKAAQWGLE